MDDANQFVESSKTQWRAIVNFAVVTPKNDRRQAAATLAAASGVGKSNLQRKFEAIHFALEAGVSKVDLIERGQRWCLAKFVTDKRNGRQDPEVVLKWAVAPQVREDAQALFNRIGSVLNLRTPNDKWEFFLSVFADVTDLELMHQAGGGNAQKQRNP
jgi:hypothetical protein